MTTFPLELKNYKGRLVSQAEITLLEEFKDQITQKITENLDRSKNRSIIMNSLLQKNRFGEANIDSQQVPSSDKERSIPAIGVKDYKAIDAPLVDDSRSSREFLSAKKPQSTDLDAVELHAKPTRNVKNQVFRKPDEEEEEEEGYMDKTPEEEDQEETRAVGGCSVEESTQVGSKRPPKEDLSSKKIKKKNTSLFLDSGSDTEELEEFEDKGGIFGSLGRVFQEEWNARRSQDDLMLPLPDFQYSGRNTIGIRVRLPHQSPSWSFNITPERDLFNNNVLMHFNPRYQRKKLLLNDKVGIWGEILFKDFDPNPRQEPLMASSLEILVQVTPVGFLVLCNKKFSAFFAHRRDPSQYRNLKIFFNARDGNGKPQDVILTEVWWGHWDSLLRAMPSSPSNSSQSMTIELEPHAKSYLSSTEKEIIQGLFESQRKSLEEKEGLQVVRKLILLEGLPCIDDLKVLQQLENSLYELFEEFQPEMISLVKGQGIGFVKVKEIADVPSILESLDNAMILWGDDNEEETEKGSEDLPEAGASPSKPKSNQYTLHLSTIEDI